MALVTVRREVARSVALTGCALALAAVGGLWAARAAATSEAIHQAEQATVLLARAVIEPAIDDDLVDGDEEAIERLDEVVLGQVLGEQVLAVRVWDADGTVLYTDDLAGIGETFPLGEAESAVLATGQPAAELSELTKEENAGQADFDELLEVYVAVEDPDGRPLLFETYQSTDRMDASTQRILRAFTPVAVGALLFLGLAGALVSWRLARRLERAQGEREQLLEQALHASEHERRTIAADLHDGVVQDLVGLTYVLDALATDESDAGRSSELSAAAATTRGSVRSLRSLLVEIYPPNLEQVGLSGAIDDLAASVRAAGTDVDVDIGADVALTRAGTAGVYRAVRESLSNVRRHARARRATVALRPGPDGSAVLTVSDDGVGFDPAAVPADHVGLRILADLAGSLDGSLTVDSTPGMGTTLTMVVPR
jgi:two-component system NarL family sensor kinase